MNTCWWSMQATASKTGITFSHICLILNMSPWRIKPKRYPCWVSRDRNPKTFLKKYWTPVHFRNPCATISVSPPFKARKHGSHVRDIPVSPSALSCSWTAPTHPVSGICWWNRAPTRLDWVPGTPSDLKRVCLCMDTNWAWIQRTRRSPSTPRLCQDLPWACHPWKMILLVA